MLRFPDCPAAVISRFTDSLKAKIDAYIKRKQHEGKRVHATTLRFVWVREFGERNGKKHYHVVLLQNRDTWCGAGDYRAPDSLAGLIKQAWCSALRVDAQQYSSLANFPQNPVLWLRGWHVLITLPDTTPKRETANAILAAARTDRLAGNTRTTGPFSGE